MVGETALSLLRGSGNGSGKLVWTHGLPGDLLLYPVSAAFRGVQTCMKAAIHGPGPGQGPFLLGEDGRLSLNPAGRLTPRIALYYHKNKQAIVNCS
ncbi:protein of unknown function [Kyrpidia spormannii]|uniref:Uncharacterized protein n=1 Tax=Kyrpidia spormannii TaxID=2055160 RepID=A0A6F9EBL0_9BACL|nr:protein of unknown function [Kyrpidia spormannii]